MKDFEYKMQEYVGLLEQHSPQEGINQTNVIGVNTFKASESHHRKPTVYTPVIIISGQGSKLCYLAGKSFNYSAGNILAVFLPMPISIEIKNASQEKPHLSAGIELDLSRLSNMLLKLDAVEQFSAKPEQLDTSGIFSAPLKESLLDTVIRLFRTLDNSSEAAILSEAIIDEICFRILSYEQGGALKFLLQQRGQVQQISKAVEHIHSNIDKQVSVEELAGLVNMSGSGFRKKFKDVMHLSPLQYSKSIKLHKAQTLIMEGKNASEAGYLVGYNSPAQFSREYKRHFGFAPSAT